MIKSIVEIVKRYLENCVVDDALADRDMAFISGPRQVGKTQLAKRCLRNSENYFNWDVVHFKRAWIKSPLVAIENTRSGPVVLRAACAVRRMVYSAPFVGQFQQANILQIDRPTGGFLGSD